MANQQNLDPHKYKKGQSGNPSGLPKGTVHSSTRLKRLLQLTEKMKNPVTGQLEDFNILEQMDMAMIVLARKGNIKAYQAVLDRLEGKPMQGVKLDGEIKTSNRYEDLTPEELERAKQILVNNATKPEK